MTVNCLYLKGVALTVKGAGGVKIKELAQSQGLTVNDYLERLISVRAEAGLAARGGDVQSIWCEAQGRKRAGVYGKVHPKVLDSDWPSLKLTEPCYR